MPRYFVTVMLLGSIFFATPAFCSEVSEASIRFSDREVEESDQSLLKGAVLLDVSDIPEDYFGMYYGGLHSNPVIIAKNSYGLKGAEIPFAFFANFNFYSLIHASTSSIHSCLTLLYRDGFIDDSNTNPECALPVRDVGDASYMWRGASFRPSLDTVVRFWDGKSSEIRGEDGRRFRLSFYKSKSGLKFALIRGTGNADRIIKFSKKSLSLMQPLFTPPITPAPYTPIVCFRKDIDGITGDIVIHDNGCGGKVVNIPPGVTKLGDNIVRNSPVSVTLPAGLKVIGPEAFKGAELGRIEIPDTVNLIQRKAFWRSGLTNVNIPSRVTKIEEYAFYDNLLTEIIIPSSVLEVGDNSFSENRISRVEIQPGLQKIGRGAFSDNRISHVVIPPGVQVIGDFAFGRNELTDITFPESIREIGEFAFAHNKLTSVIIPKHTNVHSRAFSPGVRIIRR
jgi:hypothetical protein